MVHSERAERFLAHPKRAERFFRTQKNFFLNKKATKVQKGDRKRKREELLKIFRPILDVPKTLRPFQKGQSVANELKFVVFFRRLDVWGWI
jgi:hypothetical protein